MDIVLDSNIFRSDITLRSKEFDIILDYLSKTHSSIIIPEVILDEIKGLYAKVLKERNSDVLKDINNLNLLITDHKQHIKFESFNIEDEVEKYEIYVKEKLKIKKSNIIPYNNSYLPLISQRAINRIKPAGEKGQGFRDTLIWLTMKEYCQKCHEKQIIFISNNTDDFASPDKTVLNEILENECKDLNVKINYFKTLKEFIENHSTKIDLINHDWISENLDYSLVSSLVIDYLNETEQRNVVAMIEHEIGEECESYEALRFDPHNDGELSVYEMSDNRLIVNISINGYVDFQFNIRSYEFWNNDYEYQSTSINRYESVNAYVTITLIENEIIDVEVSEIDI